MRTSLLDIALSTGLEGFDAPPSVVVEANAEDLQNQVIITTTLTDAVNAEKDIDTARQTISDLTRLGNGLEGLMIEVTRVENKNDPTTEELSALRVAAMSVRRDLLDDESRRRIDDIGEGRLEGSVEGLGDLMKNVGTKLGFAIGNFWDGVKRNFSAGGTALTKLDVKIEQLITRLRDLPDVQYTRTLSKNDAVLLSTGDGKVDATGILADVPAAIDDWFTRPMMAVIDQIEKQTLDLQATLYCTTEQEYNDLTTASAGLYIVPVPENAKKFDVVNGKHYIFDVYGVHRSFGARQRTLYVARPNPNTSINNPQYDNAVATSVSFAAISTLTGAKAAPAKVTFTKEELLNGLLQLQRGVKDLASYIKQQDVAVNAYRAYVRATGNYDAFCKNTWVSKMVLHRVSIQASAILSLFEMTCMPISGTAIDIDKLADVLKSFVYSSDLSKG